MSRRVFRPLVAVILVANALPSRQRTRALLPPPYRGPSDLFKEQPPNSWSRLLQACPGASGL
jgi:hypothetical protein